jgi:hypothetical protein
MKPIEEELARLPQCVRNQIFLFLRHPAADLVSELTFDRLEDVMMDIRFETSHLSVYGKGVSFHFIHNTWSGEAVDGLGYSRRRKNGRIDFVCRPNQRPMRVRLSHVKFGHFIVSGFLNRYGHEPHPKHVR